MNFLNYFQIAGIKDAEEAQMLIGEGVKFLGFPLRLAYHQPDTSEEEAREIIAGFPPGAKGVLITYLDKAKEIMEFSRFLGVDIVQLHGDIAMEEAVEIKMQAPHLTLIKSLIVGQEAREDLLRQASILSAWVDAFITDTFDPQTGACGATGKTHDWETSHLLAEILPKPLILAGGLNPKNVREAILRVKPAGVDAHTGVENEDGRKDLQKIRQFLAQAQQGFSDLGL